MYAGASLLRRAILGVLCYVFILDLHKHFPLRLARVPGVAASIL